MNRREGKVKRGEGVVEAAITVGPLSGPGVTYLPALAILLIWALALCGYTCDWSRRRDSYDWMNVEVNFIMLIAGEY